MNRRTLLGRFAAIVAAVVGAPGLKAERDVPRRFSSVTRGAGFAHTPVSVESPPTVYRNGVGDYTVSFKEIQAAAAHTGIMSPGLLGG